MAAKPDKGSSIKKAGLQKDNKAAKTSAKSKKQDEEENIGFEDSEETTKAGKRPVKESAEDDLDDIDDSLSKGDEEDNWDPDFDEFDLPKSSKKVLPAKKSVKDNDDEFKVDEEFQDFFNSSSSKKYNDDDEDD